MTNYRPEKKTMMVESQSEDNSISPLLPRLSWGSQIAYMKALFRAKKALDRIEKEAGYLISN
ncbi:MAG: hypothetical protein HC836_28755 [Richelia sp. RM2_1_2]|nr:hypothetical protein [Richelia sp. SM2_1_7]NJM18443.1 hypothetical protein [Richelia sp. SM1_7_0]NJN07795.1 hypothetical protein [Richelia sp. RM1_1_1]NJO28947.1 hypothetical protein [Richelia sp. SL_2_1]NJO62079.1 hypothetical protein [Richelia sp. RM2_1_2]